MTKAQRHMGRVKDLGCLVCRLMGMPDTPAEAHHLIESGRRVSDFATIPLCPEHHRGSQGIHTLHRYGFEMYFKTTELKLLAMTIEALA